MNRIKFTYITIFIVSILVVIGLSFSYAYFSSINEEHGKLNIVAGTLDYKIESSKLENNKITVPANSVETFYINITSLNNISSKYELYYMSNGSDLDNVKVVYSNNYDSSSGIIEQSETKKIEVSINNSSNTEQIIEFNIQGGLTNDNFTLAQGNSLILDNSEPSIDIRIEKVGDKTYAKIEGYDELSGISYITNGTEKQNLPKKLEPLKVYVMKRVLGESDKWYVDKTNYEYAFYGSEVVIGDDTSSSIDIAINEGYDIVVANDYAWTVPSNVSRLFDAGIDIITNGDDTTSLRLIKNAIRPTENYVFTPEAKVDNIFTQKFNLIRPCNSSGRTLINFIDEVETFYQSTVNDEIYDEIGYYNKDGTKWIHSQISPTRLSATGDTDLTDFYKISYEFIIEKNIAQFEITETGEYTFEAFDNFGNKITKTIQIEI